MLDPREGKRLRMHSSSTFDVQGAVCPPQAPAYVLLPRGWQASSGSATNRASGLSCGVLGSATPSSEGAAGSVWLPSWPTTLTYACGTGRDACHAEESYAL